MITPTFFQQFINLFAIFEMSTSKLINFPLTNYLDLQIDNRSSYKNESFWRRSNTTFAPKSSKVKGLMLQYVRSSSRSCLTNNFFPKTRFRASYLAFQSERFWAGEKNSHDRMKTKENKECFLCQTPCDNSCANCQSVYFCSSEHLKLHQVTIVEENQQVNKRWCYIYATYFQVASNSNPLIQASCQCQLLQLNFLTVS